MYIHGDFDPLRPTSSHGSSATIMPSVASTKNYVYDEPERGRSLSRSSSRSSSGSSSGILVLSPPSSTDLESTSAQLPEYFNFYPFENTRRQNPQIPYYIPGTFPPPGIAPQASTDAGRANEYAGLGFGAIHANANNSRAKIPGLPNMSGWFGPQPLTDLPAPDAGLFCPGSPGLFGPRSPREYPLPTPTRTPLSRVPELTEPISPIVSVSMGKRRAAPPPPVKAARSESVDSDRSRRARTPVIIQASRSRSTSLSAGRRTPPLSLPPPIYVRSRSSSRSRRSRSRSRSRSRLPAPVIIQAPCSPPIIVHCRRSPRSRSPSVRTSRSRSRSRSRSSRHAPLRSRHSRSRSRSPPPPIVISDTPSRSRNSNNGPRIVAHRVCSYPRSRSPSRPTIVFPAGPTHIPSVGDRRHVPARRSRSRSPPASTHRVTVPAQPRPPTIIPAGLSSPGAGNRPHRRSRSRSPAARTHRVGFHYSPERPQMPIIVPVEYNRNQLATPTIAPQVIEPRSRSPSPMRYRSRSRSPRSRSPRSARYFYPSYPRSRSRSRSRSPRYFEAPSRSHSPLPFFGNTPPPPQCTVVQPPPQSIPNSYPMPPAPRSTGARARAPRTNPDTNRLRERLPKTTRRSRSPTRIRAAPHTSRSRPRNSVHIYAPSSRSTSSSSVQGSPIIVPSHIPAVTPPPAPTQVPSVWGASAPAAYEPWGQARGNTTPYVPPYIPPMHQAGPWGPPGPAPQAPSWAQAPQPPPPPPQPPAAPWVTGGATPWIPPNISANHTINNNGNLNPWGAQNTAWGMQHNNNNWNAWGTRNAGLHLPYDDEEDWYDYYDDEFDFGGIPPNASAGGASGWGAMPPLVASGGMPSSYGAMPPLATGAGTPFVGGMSNPPPRHPRHPRFWFADGNLMIQIGVTQYKIHRYLFSRAKAFPAISLSSWGRPPNPFYLAENKVDFDRFLSVLYPLDYSEHECKTAEEWTSVLVLADKWRMEDVRRLAINHLTTCAGPVDLIALGHRCNVPEWLAPAYLALAMRKEPISSVEGAKMGVEALVRIGALKDEVFANLTEYVDQNKFSELFASKLAM